MLGWGEEIIEKAKTTGNGDEPVKVPENQLNICKETPSPNGDKGNIEKDDKAVGPVMEELPDNPECQDAARSPWSPPARRDNMPGDALATTMGHNNWAQSNSECVPQMKFKSGSYFGRLLRSVDCWRIAMQVEADLVQCVGR